jgi:uncharacterized protein YidB (DUF937 family)
MGLLDGILNAALGGSPGGKTAPAGEPATMAATPAGAALTQILGNLLQQQGGVAGLAKSFDQAGLGHLVSSWIGTGANLPVSADQIIQVLGSEQIGQIAQQLGVDHQQVGGLLAQVLPRVIDHLTPQGRVPAAPAVSSDLLGAALAGLQGRLTGH